MFFDGGGGALGLQFLKDTELNFQQKAPFGKDYKVGGTKRIWGLEPPPPPLPPFLHHC